MRRILSTVHAMAFVFAGALLTTSALAGTSTSKIQSWSDLHARYDGIVGRVAAVQKAPNAIGGGPAAITGEQEILRVYRTPSMSLDRCGSGLLAAIWPSCRNMKSMSLWGFNSARP